MSSNRLLTLLLALLAPLILVCGIYLGGHPTLLPESLRDAFVGDSEGQSVQEAVDLIERHYYRPIAEERIVNGSIAGAVASLGDRFSYYFDPETYALFLSGAYHSFSGVGMSVVEVPKGLRVSDTYPGSPAARAGIRSGATVIAVNGRSIAGLSSRISTGLIKGKTGTYVKITIVGRDGRRRVLRLRRARVEVPLVSWKLRTVNGKHLGVVRLLGFDRGAVGELRVAVKKLLSKSVGGLVLDLRGNGGGLLDQAVAVASIFIERGTIVSTEGRASPRKVYRAEGEAIAAKIPLVVLVDHNSASASEIVAAALQDHDRAQVIGARTFGKGVFQQIEPLTNGGALDITIGQYFTPRGRNLGGGGVRRGAGVRPDLRASDRSGTARDEGLDVALRQLEAIQQNG